MWNLLKNKRELICRITLIHYIETSISGKGLVMMKIKSGTTQQFKSQVPIHTTACSKQMNQFKMNQNQWWRIYLSIHSLELLQVVTLEVMEHMKCFTLSNSSSPWCSNNKWIIKMKCHHKEDISRKRTHTCINIWWVQTLEERLNTLSINNHHLCITSILLQTEGITTWQITTAILITAKSSNLKLSTKII